MISQNVSLKPFNTFGIEASARYFSTFKTADELRELLSDVVVVKNDRLVLGGGSNMLLTRNYDGVVLKNEVHGITLTAEDEKHYYIMAGAGETWHPFVMHCVEKNYAGIENLALIPGCVGAGPMQNIGAYGVELKDVFHSLEAMNIASGEIKMFDAAECAFGYRESVFKRAQKDLWVILNVTFRLNKRAVLNTSYGAIDQELDKMSVDRVTIREVAQAVIRIRTSKLPDPAVIGNAGSFFKNPVVSLTVFEKIKAAYNNAPCYPVNENEVKVPAGWLIEQAGWKGKTFEKFGVHKNQALVLVNYGGATGRQIYDLSTEIIEDINSKFGVVLEREVNII